MPDQATSGAGGERLPPLSSVGPLDDDSSAESAEEERVVKPKSTRKSAANAKPGVKKTTLKDLVVTEKGGKVKGGNLSGPACQSELTYCASRCVAASGCLTCP